MTKDFDYGKLADAIFAAVDKDSGITYHQGREVYGDFKYNLECEDITNYDDAYALFMDEFGSLV